MKKSKKKSTRADNYEGSTYTSTIDSRLEGNWGHERNQNETKYRDIPVPPSKKKKKRKPGLI